MEGSQATIIIAKLLMAIMEKFLKLLELIDKIRMRHLELSLRKAQLGYKNKSIFRSDKRELEFAKRFKRSLSKREQKLDQKIKESQYNLDSYKLEMQRKLEDHNVEIRKAQRAYDIAKENYNLNVKDKEYPKSKLEHDKKNLAELQENINNKLEQKRNFETEVNKNLLEKDKNHKELLEKHNQLLDDIKTCDRAIDGFGSKFEQHMTESLRNNFDEAVERNISNEVCENIIKNVDEVKLIDEPKESINPDKNKDDDFMKEYLEQQRRKSLAKERQKEMTKGKHQAMER